MLNSLTISGSLKSLSGSLTDCMSGSMKSLSGSLTQNITKKAMMMLATVGLVCSMIAPVDALAANGPTVRVKDISDIQGVRSNILIGYGLMVGLAGTGDTKSPLTRQTLANILERMGLNARDQIAKIKNANVAAVMITAELPPFARQGSRIDVTVSSLGDAQSLEGGQLLATPLVGADGNTYAIAQGGIILGGFTAQGRAGVVTKNHTTSGRIAEGAIVERETGFEMDQLQDLRLILKNPDLTTAMRVSEAINTKFGEEISRALDNSTVQINLPERYAEYRLPALERIEAVTLRPDAEAVVVIDEKTGTIVMGEDVRLSTVAISHANLTIRVTELPQVSQPGAFAEGGESVEVQRTNIDIQEGQGHFNMLKKEATLADLVKGLNSLGVNPRDIISILQNIKAAGAMQARLKVM